MPDQDSARDVQPVTSDADVVRQAGNLVAVTRMSRRPVAATRDPDDVKAIGEVERELVKDVRRVAEAGQQDHRWALAAPIEHLERDALLDADERDGMWRGIGPGALAATSGTDDRLPDDDRQAYGAQASHD